MTDRPSWQRVTDRLHPALYLVLAGLALWYIFAAWSFGGGAYTDYLLTVASGLILVTVAILATLWLIWRHHPPNGGFAREPYRAWAACEFCTWQDQVKAKNAAIEILLPDRRGCLRYEPVWCDRVFHRTLRDHTA